MEFQSYVTTSCQNVRELTSNKKKQGSILVAEDEISYSRVYKLKLEKEGYTVFLAQDGEEVIKVAEEKKPELILLDLMMPTMDGFETLKILKSTDKLKDIKVIVTSNLSQEDDINKAKELGAIDYFVKSNLSIQDMVNKIEGYMR